MHSRVLVGLPVLFLVLELDCLALGLYVYFPVCQLDGEAGVLTLATDSQRELVVRHDHLGLLLILVQVDLANARRAQSLSYEARGLGVPLDDVYLLVPELGDYSSHAAPPRADAGPDRVYPLLLRPYPDLRAQSSLAGYGLDLHQPVVYLRHLQVEEPLEEPLVPAAHHQVRPASWLADIQQVDLEPLAVLVALVGHLLARWQDRLDPTQVYDRHAAVGLLDDAGNDVAHTLAVLFQKLCVVYLVEALVEGLAHHLGRYAREVVGRYVLPVLHHPEVSSLPVEDHPGPLFCPLAVLVCREQGLFEHALYRLERD